MYGNGQKIIIIAQKEFADNLWNPVFISLFVLFTFVTFVYSYEYGMLYGASGLITGVQKAARIMSWFSPLVGFGLTFDTISKEERSGSLNVLLTHPVYRDNIILGKLFGSALTLFPVMVVPTVISVGTFMNILGEKIAWLELTRIALFLALIFLYTFTFSVIGLLFSLLLKNASDSVVYNIVIWLVLVMTLFDLINGFGLLSGQNFDFLFNLSPMHHYAELIGGTNSMGWGGSFDTSDIKGVFDLGFTLTQWFNEFWVNLVLLIVLPVVLFIAAFTAFLRKDITLN